MVHFLPRRGQRKSHQSLPISGLRSSLSSIRLVSATAPNVRADINNFLLLRLLLCFLCLQSEPQLIEMLYLEGASNRDC